MPKALCLISLVASILIAVLFLADAAWACSEWRHCAAAGGQSDDGYRLRADGCSDDLHELVDLSGTAQGRGTPGRESLSQLTVRFKVSDTNGPAADLPVLESCRSLTPFPAPSQTESRTSRRSSK